MKQQTFLWHLWRQHCYVDCLDRRFAESIEGLYAWRGWLGITATQVDLW